MSSIKKNILFPIIFCFAGLTSFSQEIRDDTIYTTLGDPSFLLFHDKITECEYTDKEAYAQFVKKLFVGNSVSITAKVKNPLPAKLKISEGGRNHVFILGYKERLDANELDHDWEDLKKLRDYVTALEKKKQNQGNAEPAPALKEERAGIGVNSKPPETPAVKPADRVVAPGETTTYLGLVQSGIKEFNSKNFLKAKEYFEKAIEKNTSDKLAKDWLADTDNKLFMIKADEDKVKKEEEFQAIVKSADEKFKAGNYELAQQDYQRANQIKQGDPYVASRMMQIKQKLNEFTLLAKNKEKDDKYNENIRRGDLALKEGKLEEARAAFDIAKELKAGEKYPREKIKEIDALKLKQETDMRQLAVETQFKDEMNFGLEAYNAGNRDVARSHFVKAINIKKDATAEELIKKIDRYKTDSIQIAKKAEEVLMQQKLNTEKYKSFKEKGDKAFDERNYQVAIKNYNLAYDYMQESYIKERLAEIENRIREINLANERKKQFNSLAIKLQASINNNDVTNGENFYKQILDLKLEDLSLLARLKTYQDKLDVLRREKERNDQYDSAIAKAAQAIADGAYNSALAYYKEASTVRPEDGYATKQIMYVNGLLLQIDEKKKVDQLNERKGQIRALQGEANAAIAEQRWKDALERFEKIIELDPSPAEKNFALTKIPLLQGEIRRKDSLDRLKTAPVVVDDSKLTKEEKKRRKIFLDKQAQLEKARQDTIASQLKRRNEELASSAIAGPQKRNNDSNVELVNTFVQEEAIPYKHDVLVRKYPEVNFEEAPIGQTYDPSDRKNSQTNFRIIRDILADSSSLNISDSINYIKAICKSISFNSNNSFIKILIRNNSLTDFLTGRMQLKLVRKNKEPLNVDQRFISDFPIVLPQKEFPVVYVSSASLAIEPTDILVMEISDRSSKTKLKINIPGTLYNLRKTAKL